MGDHPTPAEVEGFVWASISSDTARAVILHLAGGCRRCRAAVAHHLKSQMSLSDLPEIFLTPQQSAEYDAVIDRAFSVALKKAGEVLEERKREALALLENSALELLSEVPTHLRGAPLFEALLERSWALRHQDPQEMVRLADWARIIADRLEVEDLMVPSLVDLRCRAWIELANAYRVADDLTEAERTLAWATDLFSKGTQDELLAARLIEIQASLFSHKRLFDLADTALDFVYAVYRRNGNRHLAGRVLIKKATYLGFGGDSEEAVQILTQGLELIDQERDPRLVYLAFHNLARLLLDCGRPRDARKALFYLKARRLDSGGRVTDLKLRWVEAQINVSLGELERAEQALREVKQGFAEADLGYKAALAGLELGAVMLQRGRTDTAAQEVVQAAGVFQAIGVKREAKASLLLLRKSFEQGVANAAVLNHVIGLLRGEESAALGLLETLVE